MMNVDNSRLPEGPPGAKALIVTRGSIAALEALRPQILLTQDQSFAQDHSFVACGLWEVAMKAFTVHRGRVAPLNRVNVDTDQIIPKQFLKRIERTGFGQFLFYDWRFGADGSKNPDFVLHEPRYEGASILVAGRILAADRRASMRCGRSPTLVSAR